MSCNVSEYYSVFKRNQSKASQYQDLQMMHCENPILGCQCLSFRGSQEKMESDYRKPGSIPKTEKLLQRQDFTTNFCNIPESGTLLSSFSLGF